VWKMSLQASTPVMRAQTNGGRTRGKERGTRCSARGRRSKIRSQRRRRMEKLAGDQLVCCLTTPSPLGFSLWPHLSLIQLRV
jgi:hypothetical protein